VATKVKNNQQSNPIKFLFYSAVAITLYFNPNMADPFNAPKMYLLILFSAWLIGYMVFVPKQVSPNVKILNFIIITFTLILLTTALLTDVKVTAFLGDTQRQLGAVTYLCFAVYMLFAANFFKFDYAKMFSLVVAFLSTIYIIYGLMQYSGKDFVIWINQYNPIIGTLGNPNYAGAYMAILGTLCCSFIFLQSLRGSIRIAFAILFLGLVVNILLSNARQGIVSLAAGLTIFLNLMILKRSKILGLVSSMLALGFTSVVVLGMLQVGPLEKYLYKDSVTLRGYYWNAGINMLRENLFSGVGIDRYGANFKLYRDPSFSLRQGYELNSTNAHNVFIQYFATGGLFLGIIYLVLISYVFITALKGFRILKGNQKTFLFGIFSAWIAYIAQSIVSIDNIGLTIWGWIIGGTIIGMVSNDLKITASTNTPGKMSVVNKQTLQVKRVLTSGVLTIFSLVFVLNLSKSEFRIVDVRNMINSQTQVGAVSFGELAKTIVTDPLAQPAYKLEVSDYLIRAGLREQGIDALQKLTKSDLRHPNNYLALAMTYESAGDFKEAIKQREYLLKIDPYNAKNFLQLARLYKEIGSIDKALNMKERIIKFAPNSEQAKTAQLEITF